MNEEEEESKRGAYCGARGGQEGVIMHFECIWKRDVIPQKNVHGDRFKGNEVKKTSSNLSKYAPKFEEQIIG